MAKRKRSREGTQVLKPLLCFPKFKRPTTIVEETSSHSNSNVYQWPVADLINAYKEGDIFDYEHNRGTHDFKFELIDQISRNWDVEGSGIFTFSLENDGRYKIVDSHHRVRALLKRYELGLLKDDEINQRVTVRLVPPKSHLKAYILHGTQCGHTNRNKFTNPDLCLGYLNTKIMERLSKMECKQIKTSYYNNLSYILFAYSTKKELDRDGEWNYARIFGLRRLLKPFANLSREDRMAKSLKLADSDFDAVSEAVRFYCEYQNCLAEKKIRDKNVKLLYKAAWFGVILTDRLGSQVFTKSAQVLANKCSRNLSSLVSLIPVITGSNDSLILATVGKIAKILKAH